MTTALRLTEESLRVATVGDALKGIAQAVLRSDEPERIWTEWLVDNLGDLKTAAYKLGVQVEDGPGYVQRLKRAVLAKLVEA